MWGNNIDNFAMRSGNNFLACWYTCWGLEINPVRSGAYLGVQGDARDVVETFSKRFGIISEAFWEHAWTLAIAD